MNLCPSLHRTFHSYLVLLLLTVASFYHAKSQDSTREEKVRIYVQVADRVTMEPMTAQVRAKMASNGHVVAVAKQDEENGFYLDLPKGIVYMLEAQKEGYMVSGREVDLSAADVAEELTINLLLGNSGGYVEPDDLDAPPTLLTSIYFKNKSVDPDSAAIAEMRRLFVLLKNQPQVKLAVLGHADIPNYSIQQNVTLSELRARQVRALLIARGISPYRLSYFGFGNIQPVTPRADERPLNNRVDFHLIFSSEK
jgi:outer membrane protein OmpA-like peptidoglycan-associated protein